MLLTLTTAVGCACCTHARHWWLAHCSIAVPRRYVEDHTNQLVRTFTGNLTAMLQQVHSIRAGNMSFTRGATTSGTGAAPATHHASGGGAAMRSRLSRAGAAATAGGAPQASAGGGWAPHSNSTSNSNNSNSNSDSQQQGVVPGALSGTMSVPLRRSKGAKAQWTTSAVIAEQPSAGTESTGSNEGEQPQQSGCSVAAGSAASADTAGGSPRPEGAARARRSSGSGRVDAAAAGTPVTPNGAS